MKKKLTKKKLIIIIAIVLVLVIGLIVFINIKKKASAATSTYSYERTVDIKYDTLKDTVVASGTIDSQSTSTITTNATAIVSKINYAVGDYVREGDVVIELDTSSINKQIDRQSKNIVKQQKSLQNSYEMAQDQYYEVGDKYDKAKAARNSARDAFNVAESKINTVKEKLGYDNLVKEYEATVKECIDEKQMACELLSDDDQLKEKFTTAKNNLSEADNKINKAKDEIHNYQELLDEYKAAESAYQTAKAAYNAEEDSFANSEFKYKEGVDTDQLQDLNETLIDYKLKAKSSGQITNIAAVVGSNASGVLATIQDTSKLKISLIIDEYDILKIKLGMKAIIETDASDKQYEGEVSMISPVANTGKDGSSGFGIEVSITSGDVSDLLIGMNSEVTIVMYESDKTFIVPIDSVKDKEDGTSVIYVKGNDGQFEEFKVTKGHDNGYDVEISGANLQEGMKVKANAASSSVSVTSTAK